MKREPGILLIRVVFEVGCPADRAKAIQDRISSFAGGRFHSVIAEGFSGMTRNRQTLSFGRVELDVGKVSLSRLEDELAAGILRRIREWAHDRPSPLLSREDHGNAQDGPSLINPAGHSHGKSAAESSTVRGLNAAVKKALQEPADWSDFMSALRDNHALRRRLADEVSPKLLRSLVHSMVPGHGAWIGDFAEAMLTLHERQPLVTANSHSFRRTLWECIFSELARSQEAGFAQQSFADHVLQLMATHYSRPQSAMAADLALRLEQGSSHTSKNASLAAALAALAAKKAGAPVHDSAKTGEDSTPVTPSQTGGAWQRINSLETFLELGALPWLSAPAPGQTLETELLDLLATSPHEVCELVRRLAETGPGRKRIAREFSEPVLKRLLGAVVPADARWMIAQAVELRRLHAEKPLVSLANRDFAHVLWELCFEYLVQSSQQTFSPPFFLRHLLRRLAERSKNSYEKLLADVAMRRRTAPHTNHLEGSSGQATGTETAILALLDESIAGMPLDGPEVARFLVKPAFCQIYSDMDVLAYWLRWHKLPSWNQSTDAAEVAQRIGPLLRALPPEIRASADRTSAQTASAPPTVARGAQVADLPPAEQIKRWLHYGIWPAAVAHPEDSQLRAWLENQNHANWKTALQGCGAREPILQRIIHQLSPSLFAKITGILAGEEAKLITECLASLKTAGQQIAPGQASHWMEQAERYTLAELLRGCSSAGRRSVPVPELASRTMLALALRFRVPYERILDCVARTSRGQQAIQAICHLLRQDLETEERKSARAEEAHTAISGPGEAASDKPASSLEIGSMPNEMAAGFLRTQQPTETHPHDIGYPADISEGTAITNQAQSTEPASHKPDQFASPAMEDHVRSRLDTLAHFLRTGTLPSWAKELAGQSSYDWFEFLLEKHSLAVVEMLRKASGRPGVLDRLIRYVSTRELAQMVHAVAPEFGGFVLLCINAGSELSKEKDTSLSIGPGSIAGSMHWQVALGLLLDKPQARLSAAEFLGEFTRQAANQLGMPLAEYTSLLLGIARRRAGSGNGYGTLADMLEQSKAGTVPASGGNNEARTAAGPQAQDSPSGDSAPDQCTADRSSLDIAALPPGHNTLQKLDSLLRYGALPEAVSQGERDNFMEELSAELHENPAQCREYILKMAAHELERKRMAVFFPSRLLTALWPVILPANHTEVTPCLDLLREAAETSSTGDMAEHCRQAIAEELLHAAARPQGRRWDMAEHLRIAVLRLGEDLQLRTSTLLERMRAAASRVPMEIQAKLQPLVDRVERETAVTPALPWTKSIEPDKQARSKHPQAATSRQLPAGQAFHVGNCGAVLLWPFLSRYYQSLGLIEKTAFRDERAQNHAIRLLQYLVTGKFEASEHELLLNKILCGASPEEPLEIPSPITEPEEKLSGQLLRGVLQNWKKLRNTSIEGLRTSFLMREGKLVRKDDDWSLVVSTRSYDMLLDSLPWNLSMVRLPWMKTLLHVKWR